MESESTPLVHHPLEHLDLDKLLAERLGDFGLYQKIVYLLVCLPTALTAMVTMASVFTTHIPHHRCWVSYHFLGPSLSLLIKESLVPFTLSISGSWL